MGSHQDLILLAWDKKGCHPICEKLPHLSALQYEKDAHPSQRILTCCLIPQGVFGHHENVRSKRKELDCGLSR